MEPSHGGAPVDIHLCLLHCPRTHRHADLGGAGDVERRRRQTARAVRAAKRRVAPLHAHARQQVKQLSQRAVQSARVRRQRRAHRAAAAVRRPCRRAAAPPPGPTIPWLQGRCPRARRLRLPPPIHLQLVTSWHALLPPLPAPCPVLLLSLAALLLPCLLLVLVLLAAEQHNGCPVRPTQHLAQPLRRQDQLLEAPLQHRRRLRTQRNATAHEARRRRSASCGTGAVSRDGKAPGLTSAAATRLPSTSKSRDHSCSCAGCRRSAAGSSSCCAPAPSPAPGASA